VDHRVASADAVPEESRAVRLPLALQRDERREAPPGAEMLPERRAGLPAARLGEWPAALPADLEQANLRPEHARESCRARAAQASWLLVEAAPLEPQPLAQQPEEELSLPL
jgi:hypothetical protein